MKVVRYSLVAGAVGLGLALSPIMTPKPALRRHRRSAFRGTVPAGLPGGAS